MTSVSFKFVLRDLMDGEEKTALTGLRDGA